VLREDEVAVDHLGGDGSGVVQVALQVRVLPASKLLGFSA
jgi:hypothetical protein